MKARILLQIILSFGTLNIYGQWMDITIQEIEANGQLRSSEWIDSNILICHEGSKVLFISTDGGYTFTPKQTGLYSIGNTSHFGLDTGFIVSRFDNKIFKTIDAWDSAFPIEISDGIDTGFRGNRLSFIHFWDNKRGLVVGDSINGCLEIWTTENGGESWTKKLCDPDISVNIVNKMTAGQFPTFQESERGGWFTMSIEDRYLFRIDNYGKDWKKIYLPKAFNFQGKFAFRNDQEGIITRWPKSDSNYSFLAKTTDGGLTWDTTERIFIRIFDLRYIKNSSAKSLDGFYLFGNGFYHYDFDSGNYSQIDSLKHSSPNFYNGNIGVSFFSKDLNGNCVRVFQPNWLSIPEKKVSNTDALLVYPNPSKGKISFSAYIDAPIVISGLQGQQLFHGKMDPFDLSIQSGLSPGLYFLRIVGTGVSEIIVVE